MTTKKSSDARDSTREIDTERLETALHAGDPHAAEALPVPKNTVRLRFVGPVNPLDETEAITFRISDSSDPDDADREEATPLVTLRRGGMVDVPARAVDGLQARLSRFIFERAD